MHSQFSEKYKAYQSKLTHFIDNFRNEGEIYGDPKRNTLKLFDLEGELINIKSFKIPNAVNKIAYRYFRKSKARRSFEHALFLLECGIKTPEPIAYFQEDSGLLFGKSYYVCKHLTYDFTYRDLVHDERFPNRYEILKQFTRFTFQLHENGVEFLDHSPGNTLIISQPENRYDFYLVDLNRMQFHEKMTYEQRIKNFSRLTPDKYMVLEMSREYARLIKADSDRVFHDMWAATEKFQEKFHRKRRLKEKLKRNS